MRAASFWGFVVVGLAGTACGMLAWVVTHPRSPSSRHAGPSGRVVVPPIDPEALPDDAAAGEEAHPGDMVGLVGRYICRGESEGGRPYGGMVSISRRDDVYFLTWSLGRSQMHRGIGVRHGDVLSVSFVTADRNVGVVAYQIATVDGRVRLTGRWATFGMEAPRRETLVKQTRAEQLPDSI